MAALSVAALAEAVSEEWPPCPCRIAATFNCTLREYGWLCIPPVHAPSDVHQYSECAGRTICDGGKLLLGLGQHAAAPIAVRLWACSTIIPMETPTIDISVGPSVSLFGQASCNGPAPHEPQTAS